MHWSLLLFAAAPLAAQTIDQIRDEIRRAASASRYSLVAASLGSLTRDGEMTGGAFDVDSSPKAEVSRVALPLQGNWFGRPAEDSLRVEATLGYGELTMDFADIWSGQQPGLETRVHTRYRSFTGDLGLGPSVDLGAGFTGEVLAHAGATYVDNDADYSGPGTALTSSLLDGILFEWSGWYGVYGASCALRQWNWTVGATEVKPLLRYDLRQTVDLAVDDSAQEVDASTQWLTARCDLRAPLGVAIGSEPLHGLFGVGYRRFLGRAERELGFVDFYEVTLGVDCSAKSFLPVLGTVRVSASLLFGEDVSGWTLGGSASF